MDRERRLEVMREPTVGAFAVIVAVVVGLLVWSSLASLVPSVVLIAALWTLSRAAAGIALVHVPRARSDGLAAAISSSRATLPLVAQGVLAVVAAALWDLGPGLLACAGVVVASAAVVGLARRRLGGVTGDILGAAIVVSEAAGLLLATVA
jgi:adenosylcobinamide-GDP ribazoletransferase